MSETLASLRSDAGTSQTSIETDAGLEDPDVLGLGYACARRPPTEVDDSEWERYWSVPTLARQTPPPGGMVDSSIDSECALNGTLYSEVGGRSSEMLPRTSTPRTTPIPWASRRAGQVNDTHSSSRLNQSARSVSTQVTRRSLRSGGETCSTSGVKALSLFGVRDGRSAVAGTVVFREFCAAVKFIRSQRTLRLPANHESAQTFHAFLDTVTDAKFAGHLFHRVGSWRFLRQYYRLTGQRKEERDGRSRRWRTSDHAGKAASQARSVLIAEYARSAATSTDQSSQTVQQHGVKLDNRIEASKVWYGLCERFGPAVVSMIPMLPRTK